MKNRILLILLAVMLVFSVGLIGCGGEQAPEVTQYELTISSTEGGSVTDPGEPGPYTYNEGTVVNLVAVEAEQRYQFVNWTGDVGTIDNVNAASTTITMNDNYSVTANFEPAPTDISSTTDIILSQTNAYLESDRSSLTRDSPIVQSIFNAHRSLNNMISSEASSPEYREAIFDFYRNLIEDKGLIYGTALLDVDEYPFAGAFRAQAHWNVVDVQVLTGKPRAEVSNVLGLAGIKREIFETHGVLIVDNEGLDTRQLQVVYSILDAMPSELHNLHNIAVNHFIGNIATDEFLGVWSPTGVYILEPKVGSMEQNSFPSDILPHYSDVYSLVAVHEFNHMVDSPYNTGNEMIRNRIRTLIEQAGSDSQNYLRSMFEPGFFQDAPQEFFASISNQYFASSEHTLSLGIERFNQGRPEPLNQFLFFADVYSLGGSCTLFYTLDTDGNLTRKEIPIVRDDNGHIIELHVESEHYSFQLDADGNVVSVILP